MVKDDKGHLYTNCELLEKSVDEIRIHPGESQILAERLEKLTSKLEEASAYRQKHIKLDKYYEELRNCLPENKKQLIDEMDDCLMQIFTLYVEHFYKNGYNDGLKHSNSFKKLLSMLLGK